MRNFIRLFLIFIFLFFSRSLYSTHIVGGSLTYVHVADSTYIVTLKLYRDCSSGTAAFPNSVTITVLGYNGEPFYPSKNFTMPKGTVTPVPSNLDSCAPPPNPMPCVEEGIYTTTVTNLPPNPGGYHMYYQLIARNLSLTNVNAVCNCIGESFYAYIPGAAIEWLEWFTHPNGTTVDNDTTAWSITSGTTSVNSAQVNGNVFEVTGADSGEVTWTSQVISINTYTAGVNARVNLFETGNLEVDDSIIVSYRLNGGALTPFPTNGLLGNDFTSAVASVNGLVGNTLQLFIKVKYDSISPSSEVYLFDSVMVFANDTIINSNPVFDLFPPLFLCVGTPFTFDHKATDADGDSLVYSFYTPYDGDNNAGPKDPTFPGNVATFLPIVWVGGYSATNPLGGTPLTLNSVTGFLSGTPSAIGQYVVGVKVKEYRNGVYLSETLRDFQFNVVICPPLSQATLSPFNGCNGNPVNFAPDDTTGSDFWWDFGNTLVTNDTSNLEYASYTYPGPGTYTVTLIANKGTYCADTATSTVTTSTINASFSHDAPVCIGSTVSFADNSTKSSNSTISSYLWAFGDGNTSTSQNPTHNYASSGAYSVTLTVTNSYSCTSVYIDTVDVNPYSIASAGTSTVVCASSPAVSLSGSVTNATGGMWASSGTGSFTPNNTTLNATYTPSAADITAGIVTLTLTSTGNAPCDVSDTMQITIDASPTTASAGGDQIICGQSTATLTANSPTAGTGTWSVVSGGASINNPTSDTTGISGLVTGSSYTFRWTITNGVCPASTDDVVISVDSLPTTATAGPDQYLCNLSTATLTANAPVVGTGLWTVTYGTAALSSTVTPVTSISGMSPGDSIILRWTISKGVCVSYDEVTVVVNPYTTSVTPGNDQTVCSSSNVLLNGSISGNTTTGIWSTSGSGTFSPGATTLNASYVFSSADTAGTSVTLYLTTTNNGLCPAFVDSMRVTIEKPAMVNAGPDQSVCENNPVVTISGSVTGLSTTGQWSSTGDGNFASTTNLNTTYTPGTNDIVSGSFTIVLSSTNNSTCPATNDSLTVTVTPQPLVTAGSNQLVCSNSSVTLSGLVSGGSTTGNWTTSGTGTFTPGSTTLNGTYTPSAGDILAGQVKLILTSTNNGGCLPVSDTIDISFFDLPVVNAGVNQITCSTNPSVTLAGTISGGTASGIWSTSGTGTFAPNNTTLNGSYAITPSDIVADSILIILTSTNNGPCPAVSDTMQLKIIDQPITSLSDTSMCSNLANAIQLIGGITGDTNTLSWISSGTGTFFPNSSTNPCYYTPSAADVANGSVTIKFISKNNNPCANDTSVMTLTLFPKPIASFTASKLTCFAPIDPVLFTNTSTNANTYTWSFSDGSPIVYTTNATHNFSLTGTYTVELIADNIYGCTDTTDVEVVVTGTIIVPTAFTPDPNGPNGGRFNQGDMSNNVFFPYLAGVTDFHLLIFNRWGEIIFESFDVDIGWDGYYRDELCQQDTYVWKIDATFNDGREFHKKGSITLLR